MIKKKYLKYMGGGNYYVYPFVYNGNDMITGFNFDIDLAVWKHKVIKEKERFYIGILRPDGTYHSYHGINRNGNVGTLLYVHDNPAGIYRDNSDC